jgi:hypothetical protein
MFVSTTAISQATSNLAAADAAEALAQERDNAKPRRAVVDKFMSHAIALDDALTAISKEAIAARNVDRGA